MQDFFKSDPSMIPEIYNKYYSVLDSVSNDMIKLEKYGLELQNLCNDLGDYPNEVCFVYSGNILEVKENIQSVVIKINQISENVKILFKARIILVKNIKICFNFKQLRQSG